MKIWDQTGNINPDQIDEGFSENEDGTIAVAEQVFSGDRGISAYFLQNDCVFPEFLTKHVNLHLHSETASTSDEDYTEDDAGSELPCDIDVSSYIRI